MHRNTAMFALLCALVCVVQAAAAGPEGEGPRALIGNWPPIAHTPASGRFKRNNYTNVSPLTPGLEVAAREGDSPRELLVSWQPLAHLPRQHVYTLALRRFRHQNYTYVQAAGTSAQLQGLVPGALYELSVAPYRNELADAPLLRVPLRPLPALGLKVSGAEGRRVSLSWRGPAHADSALGGYRLRYSTPHVPVWLVLDDMPANQTEAEIEELTPGVHYIFELDTLSEFFNGIAEANTSGSPLSVEHTVRPLLATELKVSGEKPSCVMLSWSTPGNGAGVVSTLAGYRLRYSNPNVPAWHTLDDLPANQNELEIEDLTPGVLYVFELDTLHKGSNGVKATGSPLTVKHTVRPEAISNVTVTSGTDYVQLEWRQPRGRVDGYSLWWYALSAAQSVHHESDVPRPDRGVLRVRLALAARTPGDTYAITVLTKAGDVSSEAVNIQATTKPLIESGLYVLPDPDDRSNTLVAIYARTPATSTVFDSYRFTLSRTGGEAGAERRNVTIDAGDADNLVRFEGLTPGYLYDVTMVTVSNNVSSEPLSHQERLHPRDVPEVRVKRLYEGKASVEWDAPDGYYTQFEVSLVGEKGPLPRMATTALIYFALGLTPGTNYTVTVTVRAGNEPDDATYSEGRTALLQM